MAELNVQSTGTPKKSSGGKPDMTPLVDLGFLLITFFMFTTTFTQPNAIKLILPDSEGGNTMPVKKSNTLTLILGGDDKLFWHQQDLQSLTSANLFETDYTSNGIRTLIYDLRKKAINPEHFTVIIKPTDEASFKNTVDVLDEMEITSSKHFSIADMSENESQAYQSKLSLTLK